jgi:hypothetical protein
MSERQQQRIAAAIKRLASEHGVPNAFAITEIANEAGKTDVDTDMHLANSLDAIAMMTGLILFREVREDHIWIEVRHD